MEGSNVPESQITVCYGDDDTSRAKAHEYLVEHVPGSLEMRRLRVLHVAKTWEALLPVLTLS
ncbi:hypothetical protein BGE01nite_50130 [Brevifollis gellanilyticus]|uniref:Uncharacterized protein n=1 Tax=Brevifollis gellanilyticus TaxID=748831 RepID=A0A512MG63_9BACT|nr:hypothetical protein BGE01nite_50130 [Brevifollis gellanilyticus]